MARTKSNGNGRLEEKLTALEQAQTNLVQAQAHLVEAMANLAQNQAAFLTRTSTIESENAETKRRNDERFARIESILLEHSRILRGLPDAIRDKIGFKAPETRPPS